MRQPEPRSRKGEIAQASQLVPDLPGAFDLLYAIYGDNYPSFSTFITGPSRTGDIERILVLGAHGPRILTIIFCPALDHFQIETPSWGFADTGTRFGKFLQDAAAIDFKDKLADSGQIPYMIDRSHNRQAEDRGDASNRGRSRKASAIQERNEQIDAEERLRQAFFSDV